MTMQEFYQLQERNKENKQKKADWEFKRAGTPWYFPFAKEKVRVKRAREKGVKNPDPTTSLSNSLHDRINVRAVKDKSFTPLYDRNIRLNELSEGRWSKDESNAMRRAETGAIKAKAFGGELYNPYSGARMTPHAEVRTMRKNIRQAVDNRNETEFERQQRLGTYHIDKKHELKKRLQAKAYAKMHPSIRPQNESTPTVPLTVYLMEKYFGGALNEGRGSRIKQAYADYAALRDLYTRFPNKGKGTGGKPQDLEGFKNLIKVSTPSR